MPRNRAKRPEVHTLELIRLVHKMRPNGGRRRPGNASWQKVLETWNDGHEKKRRYADAASISRAYSQALRRKDLGLPTTEDGGEG